ncbi:hypothetical protein VTK56DRAFT_10265 [Thermocarpiscus australiensis]
MDKPRHSVETGMALRTTLAGRRWYLPNSDSKREPLLHPGLGGELPKIPEAVPVIRYEEEQVSRDSRLAVDNLIISDRQVRRRLSSSRSSSRCR